MHDQQHQFFMFSIFIQILGSFLLFISVIFLPVLYKNHLLKIAITICSLLFILTVYLKTTIVVFIIQNLSSILTLITITYSIMIVQNLIFLSNLLFQKTFLSTYSLQINIFFYIQNIKYKICNYNLYNQSSIKLQIIHLNITYLLQKHHLSINNKSMQTTVLGSTQQRQAMQKTGIQSIDKFFNYGQNSDKFQKYPFTPQIHTVIQMFQSEYTQNLHDRKAKAILKFCKDRQNGFFYQQIQGLTRLFELTKNDLFNGVEEMVPAIKKVLQVDTPDKNNMFNKNSGSDQLRYLKFLPSFLDSLEPLLNYKQFMSSSELMESLKQTVLQYLLRFTERQIPQIISKQQSFQNQKNDGQQLSPMKILLGQGTKHLRALCESKIIDAVLSLLNDYQNQSSILLTLTQLISYMMMYYRLAYQLNQKGVLHLILEIMLRCGDFRCQLVKIGFQIFWSSIQAVNIQTLNQLVNQQYIYSIKDMFMKVIKQGYKLEDKCLRNQILILINYILSLPQSIELFLNKKQIDNNKKQQSFLQILFYYATIDEVIFGQTKTRSTDKKVLFGTNPQDLQFKKLLWSGLLTAIQSSNDNVILIAQNSNFIKHLLIYIDTTNSSYAVTRWSSPQLRQLQQHALSILSNLILYMKDDFESKKGIFCLTKFLSNVSDIQRRQKCLKAFSNASLFDQEYKLKITEQGVMDYLLDFLQGDQKQNPIEIKQLCFTILANLCNSCKKNKKLFREKHGIDIVISYLKDKNIAISNRYILLGLSLLNCLWNSILGSRRSQQRFLNSQGLFDLLQFIQVCQYSHRKLSLSCLSYLTQNSKTISEFLQWNSQKSMVNATQLLLKLYAEQDERFGVRYQSGIITNKRKPLVPQDIKKTLLEKQEIYLKDLTQAGMQTYLVNRIKQQVEQYDIRLIIFSILYRIGFNKNDLNAHQQQQMQVVQMYPHFKIGEIWNQIRLQLRNEKTEPTFDDKHWMQTSIQQFEQQMNNCINTQTLIMKEFRKDQESELSKFYQVIKYNKQLK